MSKSEELPDWAKCSAKEAHAHVMQRSALEKVRPGVYVVTWLDDEGKHTKLSGEVTWGRARLALRLNRCMKAIEKILKTPTTLYFLPAQYYRTVAVSTGKVWGRLAWSISEDIAKKEEG